MMTSYRFCQFDTTRYFTGVYINKQRYRTVICTVENLFAGQVGVRTKNCHTLHLSLINLLTTAAGK